MRESIEAEIPEILASAPPDTSAAIRSALTCAPMRAADRLRTTDALCCGRARVTETGNLSGRAVGNGEAICRRVIWIRWQR
ncbi:hypothetical protein GmRootV213_58970 (plasmid) [Variovorax sp. V213]